MKKPTRILIVEDHTGDADLAKHEIRKVLPDCEFQTVETCDAFLSALSLFKPDVILSDYRLPHFDGISALALTRQHTPLTPVLIWTGSISEDVAVDCMKAGANNYILKDDLKRLGPAVVRALEENEPDVARRQAEQKYQSIFENSMEGIFQSTPQGRYLDVNPAMARIYGYESPRAMIEGIKDIASQIYVEPEKRAEFMHLLHVQSSIKHFEAENYRKDGTVIWTSTSARAMRDQDGNVQYYEGFVQDITQRKKAEAALRTNERRFRALTQNGLDSIALLTEAGTLVWESPAANWTLGYGPDQHIGHNIFLELMHPDDLQQSRELYARLIREPGSRHHGIFRLRHADGTWHWIEAVVTNMLDEPAIHAIVANYRDVNQQKQAEKALRENESRYRALFENMPIPIWEEDFSEVKQYLDALRQQGTTDFREYFREHPEAVTECSDRIRVLAVNNATLQMYGANSKDDLLEKVNQGLSPSEREYLQEAFINIMEGKTSHSWEGKDETITGEAIKINIAASVSPGYESDLSKVIVAMTDITERKEAEERINDLLEFNEKILNHSAMGILTYKFSGECVFANQVAADMVGTSVEQLTSQNFKTIEAWKRSGLYDAVMRAITTQTEITTDIHHLSTFGKDLWMTVHCVTFRSNEEDHVLLSISDVTERRRAEERLQQSESRYRLAIQATNDVIWEWTAATNQLLWSENARHVFGYSQEEIGPHATWWDDRVHPDDRNRVLSNLDAAIAGNGSIWMEEYRFLRKDGSYAYISDRGYIERAEGGAPVRVIGAMSDITSRKETETERQALFQILQGLANTRDLQDFLKLVHHSIAQVIHAENFFVVLRQEDSGLFEEIYSVDRYDPPAPPSTLEHSITAYVFRSGEPLLLTEDLFGELAAKGEVELVGTDSPSWLGVPLKTSGRTIGVMVVQDYEHDNRYSERDRDFLSSIAAQIALVIERKRAEMELQQKNDDLGLLSAINAAVVRGENLDSIVELLAKEMSRIFSVQGSTIYSTIYMLTPDKQSIRLQKYFFSLDVERSIEKIIGSAIPVIEIPLKEGGYFHKVMTSGQSAITSEPEEIRKWIAQFTETRFLHPVAKAMIRKLIPQIHKILNINSTIVVPLISEDETMGFLDVSSSGQFTVHDQRRIENIAGQLTAIIQRQQAEQALRESEEHYRTIFEGVQDAILVESVDGKILMVNRRACEMFGYSQTEFITRRVADLLPPSPSGQVVYGTDIPLSPEPRETLNRRADGEIFPIEISGRQVMINGEAVLLVVVRDITERKQAEEKLRSSNERFSLVSKAVNEAVWDWDLVTHQVQWNDAVCTLFNYQPDEIGQDTAWWLSNIHADDRDRIVQSIETTIESGTVNHWNGEYRYRMADGSYAFIFDRGYIIRDASGEALRMIGAMQNITERKRAEESEREQRVLAEALRDTAEMLSSTLDYGEVLDHILAAVGRVVPHDAATIMLIEAGAARVVRSHGYDQHGFDEEILGIRLHLEETPNLRHMFQTRQPAIVYDTYEYSGWHRMPSTDWLRSNVGAPISIYGEVIGFICLDSQAPKYFTAIHAERLQAFANQAALAIHNARLLKQAQEEIDERRQAEEELRASEERFRQLANNIQEGFWMTDAQTGQEIYMSPAVERIWGQPIEKLMQEPGAFLSSIFPEDQWAVLKAIERERSGERAEIEYRILRPDGSLRWVWDRAFPIFDDTGRVIRIAGISADVTERKRSAEALRESETKAKALLNALPDLMFRLDRQGTILDYKADRSDLYAQSEPTLQNKKIREISPSGFGDLIQHYILQTLETKEMQIFEYQLLIPERGLRDYEARMVISGNDEVIAIVRDITEHKRNEAETQRRADEFAALYKTARDLTAQYDLPTLLNTIVERACTLLSAPGGGVYLYDEAHEELEMVVAIGSTTQTGIRLKVGEGMAGRVALHRELLIVDDYRTWEGRSPHFETMPLRAVLEVPMLYGGRLIGVLVVQELGESQRKFTEGDAHLLALLAEYAASAVHAARLIEEIRRGAEETSALLETSLALTNLDLEATLQTIGNSAKALFSADGCRIFLMEPDGEYLRCVLALQENFAAFSNLRIKFGEGVTGAIASNGQAEIVNKMHQDPRGVQVPGTPEDEKEAIMFAPLKERDRTIGILSIRRAGDNLPFESADLELLEAFASMAASAVSNARLFEETQRRLAELEALYENGLAVGRLLKPSEIGDRIISTFARYLPWHHVTIRMRKENSDDLELVAFNLPNLKEEERKNAEQHFVARINRVGQGLSGWVIQTGTPLRTGNVHLHPQYIDTHAGIQSGLYMPLRVGERVIGVISVESEVENAFTEQDERLLATFANQTAIAFENARLYQSAQQELRERRRVEEELRESQERFQNLFENSPVATWLEDFSEVAAWLERLRAQGVEDLSEYLAGNTEELKYGVGLIRILNVNQAAVLMNGAQSKEELIEVVHTLLKEDIPQQVMIDEFEMIWKGYTSFGFEMSSHKLDGTVITGVQRFFIPVKDGVPDFARVIVTSTDISDRVNIERELRVSEAHYRALADSITDILIELNHDLHYTHWNKAYETLTGITAEEAIGKTPGELFGKTEQHGRIQKIYKEVLETQQSKSFEMVLIVNGEKRLFESNAYPSTGGVSVVAKDVTDRKRSEIILQKRFELMEYAGHHSLSELMQKAVDEVSELTDSPIGFFHFMQLDQTNLGMQTWSTNALRLFRVPSSEGSHLPVDQAGVWAEALRQRRPLIHNEYEALDTKKALPQGHVPIVREMVIPIIRNERLVAVMGVGNKPQDYTSRDLDIAARLADYAWDVTERKQMEVALELERNQLAQRVEERTADLSRANSNLARALRVKDEFLANMSHELRTPLNAILGLSESLGEQIAGPLNEKQQKYISTISESGHHLLSLINDILDLAKIDAGQITLDINKVDIRSVCQASLRMIKQLAQKKNQEVALEIEPGLGLMWADERRLKQMIVNLLGNAVKFTPENGKLGLQVQGDQEANQICFTVWDNGIGIRQEDLARLFQPFVQLDSGLARESTGTGLGLALVAQMARLHGGGVNAQSETGKGSRFTIVLPWEPVLAMDTAARMKVTGKFRAIPSDATSRPKVLLVEDTKEVVMMLQDYLELSGYQVFTAQDGLDGIVQAKHVKPDLILMDVQMPRMDGYETTRKLRDDLDFRYTPIIALTALAMPQDRERCLAAGMDEYISKPVNLKALVKIIQSCLFTQGARGQ